MDHSQYFGKNLVLVAFGVTLTISTALLAMDYFEYRFAPASQFMTEETIQSKYVDKAKYEKAIGDNSQWQNAYAELEKERNQLTKLNSAYNRSVCNNLIFEINRLSAEQRLRESDITDNLQFYKHGHARSAPEMEAGRLAAEQLRKYSEQLGQQIIQARSDYARCNQAL